MTEQVSVGKRDYFNLDWDIRYSDLKNTKYWQNLITWINVNKDEITCVMYRKSPNDRVHVRIRLTDEHSMLSLLAARALLYDDPFRIWNDLRRIAKHQLRTIDTDVLFDAKVPMNDLMPVMWAGEWHLLFDGKQIIDDQSPLDAK
jgi:hypothetical protein